MPNFKLAGKVLKLQGNALATQKEKVRVEGMVTPAHREKKERIKYRQGQCLTQNKK